MNSLYSVLLKNTILLALVIVSLIFIFTNYIGFTDVYYVFGGIGVLYFIASCYETYSLSQTHSNTRRFVYFTDGFFAKRLIKIIVLTTAAILLYFSHSIIKYLSFICLLIAITEIIITIWRYLKKLSFITLTDFEIIVSTNKPEAMAIKNIAKIETRHGLTYFVDTQNNSLTIRTDMMPEKEAFYNELKKWLADHQLINKLIEQ